MCVVFGSDESRMVKNSKEGLPLTTSLGHQGRRWAAPNLGASSAAVQVETKHPNSTLFQSC